jgi:hypothetical protein
LVDPKKQYLLTSSSYEDEAMLPVVETPGMLREGLEVELAGAGVAAAGAGAEAGAGAGAFLGAAAGAGAGAGATGVARVGWFLRCIEVFAGAGFLEDFM